MWILFVLTVGFKKIENVYTFRRVHQSSGEYMEVLKCKLSYTELSMEKFVSGFSIIFKSINDLKSPGFEKKII